MAESGGGQFGTRLARIAVAAVIIAAVLLALALAPRYTPPPQRCSGGAFGTIYDPAGSVIEVKPAPSGPCSR